MYSEKYIKNKMVLSLNCLILGQAYENCLTENIGETYKDDSDVEIQFSNFTVSNFKVKLFRNGEVSEVVRNAGKMDLWKVDSKKVEEEKNNLKKFTKSDIIEKLGGEMMLPQFLFKRYFDVNREMVIEGIHIFIVPTSNANPPRSVTQVFENTDEVLRKVESHWENLKDKLVEKIELKTFRVTNHIYEEDINASGIPVINNKPSFILHSLPNNPENTDHEGYLQEETLTNLLTEVMNNPWLFLLGTSGSGKTRSLYELLCKTFGIYLSLGAGNGSKNLGSQDMDVSIDELNQYLTANDPEINTTYALRFTRAIILGRLFILSKLLDFHNQDYNSNFTPKQWLLMQLLPMQISGEDFWITISCEFRVLRLEDQDALISTFIGKIQTLIPKQKLPIVIDESQVAINKHEKRFSTTITNGPLRPFFAILLRAVLKLRTGQLCLVLSGTGMGFYDIKNNTASAVTKSGGATYRNFFSLHDGFYKCDEMSKFIQRFLPLDDKLIRTTYNIFRGRRRFIIQFMESALLDSSLMSKNNMDQIVNNWQDRAKDSIIATFMELCFPRLREKKEAWKKVLDIVILSMFSRDTKIVRGGGVSEMVQYGFAQLCSFKHLADLITLQEDAITVQIAEPIPILAFREYIRKHPEEFETWLYQNLSSVHYNASCAGFLFEPCLTIPLSELFNAESCKEHDLFTNIENIDNLNLLSCKVTIRNFDDRNSAKFSSNGIMKKDGCNLPGYLDNPTTAFFMPEKEAGPDLVFIVQFHTPNGIVEVPAFLQAKLVKNSPSDTGCTTDPYHFYRHGSKRTESKEKLRKEVLDCLKSKYCKAHELSWIRFLVVFPAEANAESEYITHDEESRPQRTLDSYYNYSKVNELLIVIDPSNAELFFSSFGHNVLKELKRIADNDELEFERATKKIKTD